MSEKSVALRYECLDAGCDWKVEVGSEHELFEVVNEHMASAHGSFELEDVILDNALATTSQDSVESKG
jgi:predicted small metal-binding protein